MSFHRKDAPPSSYHLRGNPGPLLPGDDFLNDPVANGFPTKVPAPMDGQLSGPHPNEGTYCVGFNEDGTSAVANRPVGALGDNTDQLDNLLNEKLPRITRQTGTTALPTSSLTITRDVFVGAPGTANNQEVRDRLIAVLDDEDNAVLNDAGTEAIVAALIHDGSSNNVVGTPADGFYGTPTVTFNEPIPAGVNYRIYFGVASSAAEIIEDYKIAWAGEQIRTLAEVPGAVSILLGQLHAPAAAQAWDDPWDATIRALAQRGLDGAYRRATALPIPLETYNVAGGGAYIHRDGAAPRVGFEETPLAYDDPINAHWVALDAGDSGSLALPTAQGASPTGFVAYAARRQIIGAGSNEESGTLFASSFLSVWPHDFSGTVTDAKTQITPSLNAVLRPTSKGGTPGTILLNVADFFHQGGVTAIAVGYDMLEVTRATGKVETYIISGLSSADPRFCALSDLGGEMAGSGFDALDEVVQCRWLSLLFQQGGGAQQYRAAAGGTAANTQWDALTYAAPPRLTTDPATYEVASKPAEFFASSSKSSSAGGVGTALAWGGFDDDLAVATHVAKGRLQGDGSVEATQLRCGVRSEPINVSMLIEWNPREEGALLEISPLAPGTHTVTIQLHSDYMQRVGDQIFVSVMQPGGGSSIALSWSSDFVFSGGDAAPGMGAGVITLYSGVRTNNGPLGGAVFLMTKTVY